MPDDVKVESVLNVGHKSKREEKAEKSSKEAHLTDDKPQSLKNIQNPGQLVSTESLHIIKQGEVIVKNECIFELEL